VLHQIFKTISTTGNVLIVRLSLSRQTFTVIFYILLSLWKSSLTLWNWWHV